MTSMKERSKKGENNEYNKCISYCLLPSPHCSICLIDFNKYQPFCTHLACYLFQWFFFKFFKFFNGFQMDPENIFEHHRFLKVLISLSILPFRAPQIQAVRRATLDIGFKTGNHICKSQIQTNFMSCRWKWCHFSFLKAIRLGNLLNFTKASISKFELEQTRIGNWAVRRNCKGEY